MATATLDPVYLSTYLELPLATINTVLELPTAELVNSVLVAVTLKAHEHEELKKDEIEFENKVRGSENKIQGLKSTVEKAQKDVEELRQQLKSEENTRCALETELQTVKSSSSTSTSEAESLRNRISSLESANRDTVAVLEAKTTANDVLAQDLREQHQKALELRQQNTALQQTLQNAESNVSSAKFREQSLEVELGLAKKNVEYWENEANLKAAEALKSRKEKGARIAELTRQNEDLNADLTAAKRTEQALRNRLDELQNKAEESFSTIQQLRESAATIQEDHRQELEKSLRLAELQSQSAERSRNRLAEVELTLEKKLGEFNANIVRAEQDAESYRVELEKKEEIVKELEASLAERGERGERIEELGPASPAPNSRPGTPRNRLNGSTMGRLGSPAGSPSLQKIATTATNDYFRVKTELGVAKRRIAELEAYIQEMMQGLEAKQPEFEELETECKRLEQENIQMSKFVDQARNEKEKANKGARISQSNANAAQTEANILRQQARDLSVQIKVLLCELDAHDRGDALTGLEKAQLERIARGELSEEAVLDSGVSDTDKFISQRLVVFHSVSELQEKNEELLRLTRTLGAQMESEEALAAKNQAAAEHEEVLSLRTKVELLKDELKGMITRSETYIQERDLFRRRLEYRGQSTAESELGSVFGQSIDGDGNGIMSSIEQSPGSRNHSDSHALLRALQSQFDQYKEEQTIDRKTLKEQATKLSADKISLQAQIAKVTSQLNHANERHEMLNANYTMLQNENRELQKRSQLLSENAAKQEMRTQQVAEDLIEAKGMVESMRNENANLKAEKKLWKDIQDRSHTENASLKKEKDDLSQLLTTQQSIQNEHEISSKESTRRLTSQNEKLDAELTSTKRKLNEEVEENKKTQLRKDYDLREAQKRIDDLMASLSGVREELVAAKTTRDHLQARVDELVIELKSAEERVELLQPRPTPRSGANADTSAVGQENEAQDSISREQELAIEISELKRDLDLAKADLENNRAEIEQYRQISQQSEEDLQSLNEAQEAYREETDRFIEEKDTKIRELQQRVEDISSELSTTNDELTGLRNQQSEVTRRHEEEKISLEAQITRLKDEDERHSTAAQFHQQDLRAQAEIATKAQQDYETELVKHAEAAKTLQSLRNEYNQLKSEVITFKTEAESAKTTLSQSQSSWEERKEQLEKEMKELRTRRDEIGAQNKLLHQQLESVTSQISALQQSRAAFTDDGELEPTANGANDRNVEELRELVKYLRREKEIVDVQYDLSQQEAKRLKQQFDYSQSQLDEARLKLDQERRSQADGARSSMAHKDLMEKLNELNLFRESSITLRNEARQAQSQLAEKTQRVEELLGQIQPLETKIQELENVRETQDGEMRLLQEDRDRWQKRTQDIISKYDRIDPAEMEQLRETIATLQAEKDALTAEQEPLRTQAQTFDEERKKWQQTREKLIENARSKNREQVKTIADRTAERDAAIQEKDALQEQISTLRQELETALQEKRNVEQRLETLQGELESLKSEMESAKSEMESVKSELETVKSARDEAIAYARPTSSGRSENASQSAASVENVDAFQQSLQTMTLSKEAVEKELQATRVELNAAKQELETVKAERDQALAKAAATESAQAVAKAAGNAQDDAEEGQINEAGSKALSDDERQALQARVEAAEAQVKELEGKLAETEANMQTTLKLRSDKMKTTLNDKLVKSREEERQKYEAKLAQDKVIWMAENALPSSTAAVTAVTQVADASAPGTPQKVQGDALKSIDFTELADPQIRELLATNPTLKAIVANNVRKKMEVEIQKIKEESTTTIADAEQAAAQKLLDAEKKSEEAKVAAVAMETHKSSVKLNIADNQKKLAWAKLHVVETAAKETPEKPVGEVWEVAKLAKPIVPTAAVTKDVVTTTPAVQTPVQAKVEPAATNSSLPQPAAQPPSGPAATNGSSLPVSTSSIPTQPSANRNVSGSGIPQPRGGSNIGRGNGRGASRGVYSVQNGRGRGFQGPNNQGSRPPSAMGTNPAAPTFSPGQKRQREESQGGQEGNGVKRSRGGGGGRGGGQSN